MKNKLSYILCLLISISLLFSCNKRSKTDYTDIGNICREIKLSTLRVNIEDLFEKDIKDIYGKTRHVVMTANIDCELKYDLRKITKKDDSTLVMPPCIIITSVNFDNSTYIDGGEYKYPNEEEILFRNAINNEVKARLNENGYVEKSFEYAKNQLHKLLDSNIRIISYKESIE